MSRGNKAQTNPLDLLLVAMVFFIGLGLLLFVNFLVTKDMIISKQTIYLSMDIDDSGSELVSLLGATSGGKTFMHVLGETLAQNHERFTVDKTKELADLQKATGYSLVFSSLTTTSLASGTSKTCIMNDNSAHPEKLLWPATGVRTVTSKPGYRLHPIDKVCKCHTGVDIPGGGFSVNATASGVVEYTGAVSGYGNLVIIAHEGEWKGYRSLYGHLDSISVKQGQTVNKGAEIGISGNTGKSTGAHLHFELTKNYKHVDPCKFIDNPPDGCFALDKCSPEETDSSSYLAYVPVPGAQEGNIKKTVELRK